MKDVEKERFVLNTPISERERERERERPISFSKTRE